MRASRSIRKGARPGLAPRVLADRLHSAAIHLLRSVRRVDARTGLSGPRLSALSVVVFAGPVTLGELAAAEQVRPPTMTRLVQALETRGLVTRTVDAADRRIVRAELTTLGRERQAAGAAQLEKVQAEFVAMVPAPDRVMLARTLAAVR